MQKYLDPEIQKIADYYHADRVIKRADESGYDKVLRFEYPSKWSWSQFTVLVVPCDKFGMVYSNVTPFRHCRNPFI